MTEGEKFLEQPPEQKEYSFEKGVEEVLFRVEQLFQEKEAVVIAVTGSSNDVGKTFFSNILSKKLQEKGIAVMSVSSLSSVMFEYTIFLGGSDNKLKALILDAESLPYKYPKYAKNVDDVEGFKYGQNEELKTKAEKFGMPFSKIDLRILVYRQDKPFMEDEKAFADILICNEQAVDDQRKYRGKFRK